MANSGLFLLSGRMLAATLVAPAAAPPAIFFLLGLLSDDPLGTLLLSPLLPLSLFTVPGIYAYALAFPMVLVLGFALTAAAHSRPSLRPRRIWIGIGAIFGALLALFLGGFRLDTFLAGAAAGAACALTYRLILGSSLRRCTASHVSADKALNRR